MKFITDLHIHSRFSRACSRDLNPENLWKWGQIKGIQVIGTGDFTHPQWLADLQEKLEPGANNLLKLRKSYCSELVPISCQADVSFMLSTEISCIYSKNGRTRKVHALIFVPDFAAAIKINQVLARIGNLNSDGRPILGLDAKKLLEIVLEASPEAMLVPAHAWTPHFSVFGSASGFDSLEECFEELTPHIHAIETGLSSDPAMNWRLSALDNIVLISNSDAHSPSKLGREATIFDSELSYDGIIGGIKRRQGVVGTIEFFPELGKYHVDGHRDCGVRFMPRETIARDYTCPSCGKRVTVGVLHRVELLADRADGFIPASATPYCSIIPLVEIIAATRNVGAGSKKVQQEYFALLDRLGNEFSILLDVPQSDLDIATSTAIAEAISNMRSGNVKLEPGFDGLFGSIAR
jgi:uncharacterized protein (TIGR00375 family)